MKTQQAIAQLKADILEALGLPKDAEIRKLEFVKAKKEYHGEVQSQGRWYPFVYGEKDCELMEPLKIENIIQD